MGEYKKMVEALSNLCSDLKKKISELEKSLEEKDYKIGELESELNIENGFRIDGSNDRKKEFNEICDMFNDTMKEYNKGGVIRFLAELTQKLRENGVAYTVESLGDEINVKDIETGNPRKTTVSIDGIPKGYTAEKICEIVRAYEDIKHCEEHAGEHLHSEEHLKIISLRQEIECLKRNSSKKDELIKTLKKDSEEMKNRIAVLNDKYQSGCIEKTQLHTALDVMTEKYQRLRDIHGL